MSKDQVMSVHVTQFVAADSGDCTMTDAVEIGSAIKLDPGAHAVSFSEAGFRWGVVNSKGVALGDDAAVAEAGTWMVEAAQDGAERWLKLESFTKASKESKKSK